MHARARDIEVDRVITIGTDADDVADVLVAVGRRDRLTQRHHAVGRADRVTGACHGDDRHQQAILD